jgi:hypothetical protein
MFKFIVILLVALLACAYGFSPVKPMGRVGARALTKAAPVNMAPTDMAIETTNFLSQFSNVIAAEGDFGGYTGPAASLILIGALIVVLAPPLASPDQD